MDHYTKEETLNITEMCKVTGENVKLWRERLDNWEDWREEKDKRDDLNQKALDALIKKAQAVPMGEYDNSFGSQLKIALAENHNAIRTIRKGNSHGFEVKAATMTEGTHLTGTGAVRSYLEPAIKPTTGYNFRDIASIVNTSTGLITLPREISSSGSISKTPENTNKPQLDYTFAMVDFKADYIPGYARISKQMLQDLPYLQTWLPRMLIRDFYKAENNQFYLDLASVATGVAGAAGSNYGEFLINSLASLGTAGFVPNAILGTYAKWAELLLIKGSAGSGYGAPGVIVTDPNGTIRIAGIPYYPVPWLPTNKTVIGDFTQLAIAVADPLKVEFFEQDQDNVIKNLITVRVEAREVLVVELTDAFIVA
jgi:HK97 family phage major capsid protein